MSHGWNATSCQILNPAIDRWFSSTMQRPMARVNCSNEKNFSVRRRKGAMRRDFVFGGSQISSKGVRS
jgi:hypothetical protein